MGDSYALIALAALTQAAIRNLLPHPERRAPGAAGTPTQPHDQELRPVPSRTLDDASALARAQFGAAPVLLHPVPTPPQPHKSGRRGSPGHLEGTMTR